MLFLKGKCQSFINISAIVLFGIVLSACSTPQKSRYAAIAGAFAGGALIGAGTAPSNERKELHAMYWAGLAGLGAALISDHVFSDQAEIEKAQLENDKLKAELDLIQNSNKVLLSEGKGYFKNSSGEEFFQGGKAKWRIYQVNKWVKESPTRIYHQDKMVELIPETEK